MISLRTDSGKSASTSLRLRFGKSTLRSAAKHCIRMTRPDPPRDTGAMGAEHLFSNTSNGSAIV